MLGSTRSASRAQKQQAPPAPPSPSSHNSAYSETLSDEADLAPPDDVDVEMVDSEDPLALAPELSPPELELDDGDGNEMSDRESSGEPSPVPDDDVDIEDEDEEEEEEEEEESSDDDGGYVSDGETEAIRREMDALLETVPGLQDQYQLVDRLGEGTFSSVYKAIDLQFDKFDNHLWAPPKSRGGNVYVALKRIYVTSSPIRIFNELDILNDLQGESNVAYLISAIRHEDQVIAVMPFNRHQDYRTYYRSASLPLLRSYFASLFRALGGTHRKEIIHRDVKPANFLYDTISATGILCDYGLAEKIGGDEWYEWKAECCHSLPGPSFGGLEGRAACNKRVERLLPGQAPGLSAGLHGARLVIPISLHDQSAQQEREWGKLKAEHFLDEDRFEDDSITNLLKKRPWCPKGPIKEELKNRNREQLSWYKNWQPVEITSGRPLRVGHIADDKDRRSSVRANRAGTRGFRAPEVLFKCPDQTVALDIWSAGIILLCFLTRRFPFFNSNDDTEALAEITAIFGKRKLEKCAALHNRTFQTNVPDFETPRHADLHALVKSLCPTIIVHNSPDPYGPIPSSSSMDKQWYKGSEIFQAVDLMKRCLELDCTKRWTAEELLEHPFFDSGDFDLGRGVVGPRHPHRLSFYEERPTGEVTLEEFEMWAIDRVRLISDIESAQARNRPYEEIKVIVSARAKTYLPLNSNSAKNVDLDGERRKDLYSHFILCLAFSRSEELRERYVRAEKMLFRIRWEMDDPDERKEFLTSLNFGWDVVSDEEKTKFRGQLAAASGFRDESKVDSESYFKVHWTKVSDLVEKRRVFVHRGQAYVPTREELSLVSAEFTSRLARKLEMTAKALPRLDEDDRVLPVLDHLSNAFTAGITSEYTVSTNKLGEAITAEMIPSLAATSFPMCMRSMQDTLKSSHHLKHEGRQQLNLFLKGIGLSVEEAVFFWRKSFSNITDDKFNKEYKYNVRHGYGLEGSRKAYSPKNCVQIINGKSPGPGESHGCPFRHYSEANLATALSSTYNLSSADQKEIINATKQHHYHIACTRLFEIQHASKGVAKGDGIGKGDSVDHPNRYFDASRELYVVKTDEDGKLKEEKMEVD
ncbi:hypothetical protein RQP46_000364 [Phenoliferia psychrophenolica]